MEDNPELNAFRRRWREEVSRRNKSPTLPKQNSSQPAGPELDPPPPTRHRVTDFKEDVEEDLGQDYGEFVQRTEHLTLRAHDEDAFQRTPQKEPSSALEHFEKAVEKEAQGSLGDSLAHYRKAYKLDSAIDKKYRNKHFASKTAQSQTENKVPESPDKTDELVVLPTPQLILSFAGLPIPQAEPFIEGTPPPPCPIANISNDILVEILTHIALMDPASLCRMSLVCKRFAFHFAHEQHIWKRLCQGPEFGFQSMHYSFACDLAGHPYHTLAPRYTPFPRGIPAQIPDPLSTWSEVFQIFPRIRFTGIYISTVNYTRPGGASTFTTESWNSPIHIVTYYRYIRFYPDGSVIFLTTTTEPMDVVPHISKENVAAAKPVDHRQHHRKRSEIAAQEASTSGAPVPAVAMQALKHALRGHWHLNAPTAHETESPAQFPAPPLNSNEAPAPEERDPRDLVIETEGVGPKYTYILHLGLRSSNPARIVGATKSPPNVSRNTKLAWKGFWSYNKLTDDWAEFGLRNDRIRSFVFRRVRGWGL
ncbi:putative F-box protein [Talaromyces proteolyticus]|uniref:F-box protein n=1 Tax=Talaromyces proteolyticus TaxID=1131652 RepID=A0AAD4Q5R1_9EURO|nr:putative F-box protein [Talaromyces proteolyticus]KAH8704818.1 putative F-box protein [Talaromyces proteolyticus]